MTTPPHFRRGAGSRLRSFLEDPSRAAGTLAYHELEGFLFALASAPELVGPSEWMPIVFGGTNPTFESLDEARAVTTDLMTLYNSINAAVGEHGPVLLAESLFRTDALANLDEDAPISQWSCGFLRGHQWLRESWDAHLPNEIDEEFAAMLMALSFFASRQLAEAYVKEVGGGELAEVATTMRRVFPDALGEYARLGRTIHRVLMTRGEGPSERQPDKVGRNAPCPCGSGRKHKKCCGAGRP